MTLQEKIIRILLWVMMGVSILFTLIYTTGNMGEGPYLVWAYILLGFGVIAAVVFPLISLFSNPKALKNFVFVLVGIAALIGISYGLASDQLLNLPADNLDNNPKTLKMVGTGLWAMYILLAAAIGSVFYAEIAKQFK